MKCNQTGKIFKVTVSALSRDDDGSLARNDLFGGSQLLMKEMYPAEGCVGIEGSASGSQ